MGDYYSSLTGMHYLSKEHKEDAEKKYLADLDRKKIKQISELNEQNKKIIEESKKNAEKIIEEQEKTREEARRNAEMIAEAKIQAEEDRFENEKRLEDERYNNNLKLETLKRATRLCDEVGIDYDELVQFYFALEHYGNKEIVNKIEKLSDEKSVLFSNIVNIIEKQKESVKDVKKLLEQKKSEYNTIDSKRQELISNLQILDKKHNRIFRIIKKQKNILEEENELIQLQNEINTKEEELNSIKNEINKLNMRFADLVIEENERYKLNNTPQLKEELEKYNILKSQIELLCLENKEFINNKIFFKEFNLFRENHYNQEIETLFRKLNIGFSFISEKQVKGKGTIKDYLNYIGEIIYNKDKNLLLKYNSNFEETNDDIDSLLVDVVEISINKKEISSEIITKEFQVGYARAGRIIDQMEEIGIISGYAGSKPREVLITKEDWKLLSKRFLSEEDYISRNLYLDKEEINNIETENLKYSNTFCSICGNNINVGEKICSKCGTPISSHTLELRL